jgi:hypothetical protein
MKRYKILVFILLLILILNLFVFSVNATTYITISDSSFAYGRIVNSMVNFCTNNSLPNLSYYYFYSGEVDINVVSDSGVNVSKVLITNNSYVNVVQYGIGSANALQIDLYSYLGRNLPVGNYTVSVVFKSANMFNGSSNLILNGSFKYKFSALSSNTFYSLVGLSTTFNLVYNNDYNYTSNKASFTMQYSNFSFNYFTFLNTDIVSNGALGGFHLLTYSINNNVVNCSFDNTFVNLSNPHYLVWTVHGLDIDGNAIDLSGSTSFNLNAPNVPNVPKGVLVITSPQTGDNFASGTTQIPVSVVYGGDVTNVTDPNYNHTSVTVGATHALHNAGYVDLTSYSVINGTTVWNGTLTLNSGEGDGEYTLLASLDRTTLMSDTVTITIGSTTGNAVLDFLKAVWQEFKDWFVNTMKALFVPNATDFSSQIAQGWVQVSNPLPSVTPQYTIDIPMSKALGTQNGVATIDFKTPITSWSGYSTMQSVIRVGLYTLLIFLIWSMVT